MLLRWICIIFAIFFLFPIINSSQQKSQTKVRKEKGVDFVDLDEKDTDDIVMKWNEQAISGVLAAVASKNAKYLTKDELKHLEICSKDADTIEKHAECILPALHAKTYRKEFNKDFQNSQDIIKSFVPTKFETSKNSAEFRPRPKFENSEGSEEFRSRQNSVKFQNSRSSAEFRSAKLQNSRSSAEFHPRSNSAKFQNAKNSAEFRARPMPETMIPQKSFSKPMRKFRTDTIPQRKNLSNFRFPNAKRINSAERGSFPKSYRMEKYSIQKIGKKPYRKHFFTAKSLDFRNRLPHPWRPSSSKEIIRKQKDEYYYQQKIGSFVIDQEPIRRRRKRFTPKSASSYNSINDSQRKLTPIGLFAKFFMDDIIAKKNKTGRVPWQNMVEKAKQTAAKKKDMKRRMRMMEQSPLEEMAFKFLDRNGSPPRDMDEMMKKLFSDKDFRAAEKKKANEGSPHRKILQLMRDGIKLAFGAAGKNTTNFDDKNLKIMSPRLFSVTKDDEGEDGEDDDAIDVLSPSLLNFHGNGSGLERDLSLPNLVKGFTTADQQQWLDLIFEASGVEDSLKQAEEALIAQEFQARSKRSYEQRMRGPDGEPLYFTKDKAIETLGDPEAKRIEVSEILIKSYTKSQMKEMNETGYAILSKEQMAIVYGKGSPHADSEKLEMFGNMSAEEIHRRIEKDIKAIAEKRVIRKKRTILLSPFVGSSVLFAPEVASQPIILSPILFTSVIGSPAVLGPIVLGPWLFLPLILSPRLLSPAILNPFLFVPIILSPLALHPAILCPGMFNPIVLSPLALAPFILSPQVFTPIILSPLVLSPFILTPTVGNPVILSPFVLTPVIYSPLALFALVLSPNALSPLIESKLYLAEVILSPSFLS